jgi:hypothetical protein
MANELVDLIGDNQEWLDAVKPGVSAGYSDWQTATKRIVRIAAAENLNAYAIRKDKAVAGIATVIRNQTVRVQAAAGPVDMAGFDFDYWTDESGFTDRDHDRIVGGMIVAENVIAGEPIFAALKPDEIDRASGLTKRLHEYGRPGPIEAPHGDRYGVTKDGADLQFYLSYL